MVFRCFCLLFFFFFFFSFLESWILNLGLHWNFDSERIYTRVCIYIYYIFIFILILGYNFFWLTNGVSRRGRNKVLLSLEIFFFPLKRNKNSQMFWVVVLCLWLSFEVESEISGIFCLSFLFLFSWYTKNFGRFLVFINSWSMWERLSLPVFHCPNFCIVVKNSLV